MPIQAELGIGILAVSTASLFIRFAQTDTPSLVIAVFRMGLAALILGPFALVICRAELKRLSIGQYLLTGLSGLFLALHFTAWITSLETTSVASSVVLVTTTPLWVAVFSGLILNEKVQTRVWVGLSVALVGTVAVTISDSCGIGIHGLNCAAGANLLASKALWGDALALFGAWMAAGYMLVGRSVRPHVSLTTYIFLVYTFAALFLLALTAGAGKSLLGYSPASYGWMIALAVIPQLIGHSSFNYALGKLPAAYVSVALLGEPVGSTILAYFFLAEVPSPIKLAGAAVILAGIWISLEKNG
jgi:drug/metabolite transporter (DMT)-like permease